MEAYDGPIVQPIPVRIPVGMRISAVVQSRLPWNAAAFSGFQGTTETGVPGLVIGFEWPLTWPWGGAHMARFDRESLYLRRYSSDHAIAVGSHAFTAVEAGEDPPDATVLTGAGRIGVESTALTFEGRRAAHGLFLELRRALEAAEPATFEKLAGHLVYVWFEDSDLPGPPVRPHKRSDTEALDSLLDALARYRPIDPSLSTLMSYTGEHPERLPELQQHGTAAGARFFAVPIAGGAPGSLLYAGAGFDIGLAYTSVLTSQTAWSELQRLLDSHDKPGVDLLLITAAGPDSNGNLFPAEAAFADFAVEHALGFARAPDHIGQVILHSWSTGRATRLHPTVEPIFGPLYDAIVPVWHPPA